MSTVSPDNQRAWTVTADERPASLEVILLDRTYVFPWSQFVYAEGGADEVRLAFTTHDVVVSGSSLNALLRDLAAQRVSLLSQSYQSERFVSGTALQINRISVRKVD